MSASKEKTAAYLKNWHAKNPGKKRQYAKQVQAREGVDPAYRLRVQASKCASRAKKDGLPADKAFLLSLCANPPKTCVCCGTDIDYSLGAGKDPNGRCFSFDKGIPALGYVPGNVEIICFRCNTRKGDLTHEEFMQLWKYFARFHVGTT